MVSRYLILLLVVSKGALQSFGFRLCRFTFHSIGSRCGTRGINDSRNVSKGGVCYRLVLTHILVVVGLVKDG